MKKIKTALTCIGILLTLASSAQISSQFPLGTSPMLYNGGFAGENKQARFNAGANVYSNLGPNFGYFASYDQFFSKIGTGIGVTYSHDTFSNREPQYPISRKNFRDFLMLSISPKFSFKGKYTLAPFIDVSYTDLKSNESPPGNNNLGHSTSLRTGFLFNTTKFYAGFTVYAYTKRAFGQNNTSYTGAASTTWAAQAGYTFQRSPESDFSFTPQVAVYMSPRLTSAGNNGTIGSTTSTTKSYLRGDINLMFRYKKINLSLNNSNNFSVGVGAQLKKFRVLLNKSIFSDGYGYSPGNISLSARYILK